MSAPVRYRDREEEATGLLGAVKNLVLSPLLLVFSRPARRLYLTAILLGTTAVLLLGSAIVAYTLFYNSYIPRIGFERTIHLQYDHVYSSLQTGVHDAHPYPYGHVFLQSDLRASQKYDITIELTLPRTPTNQAAGNFMLEVTMYNPSSDSTSFSAARPSNILDVLRKDSLTATSTSNAVSSATPTILARSRRTAMLPYRSPLVDLLHRLTTLPFYILRLRTETHVLRIPVFEGVSFPRGRRAQPTALQLEVQSAGATPLHVYGAKVAFRARFEGLRWLMYRHRILSAVVFVAAFWFTALLGAALAWALVTVYLAGGETKRGKRGGVGRVKKEEGLEDEEEEHEGEEDGKGYRLSDTERTFPTLRNQAPLRYTSASDPEIKREDVDAPVMVPEAVVLTPAAEADDEDEDVDFFDSGIGTSMDSSATQRRESLRRRRGRMGGREEDVKPIV